MAEMVVWSTPQAALAARNASDEGEVQDGRDGLRSEPMSLDDYDD